MVNEHSTKGFGFKTIPIPTVSIEKWKEVSEEARSSLLPLFIPSLFHEQSAKWTPEKMASQWANKEVGVVVDLPSHGVPYRERSKDYQKRMKLGDFISLLGTGKVCYLNQAPLVEYPELESDFNLKNLGIDRIFALNLWIGSKTRSGLHFDNADNLFGQINGRKKALLVSPVYSKFLYPFADNPSKSQIDLDQPNLKDFPKCKRIEVWSCDLGPGDALYMPRGWWHHICAEEISICINCWHGDSLSEFEYMKMFLAGGARVMWRAVYDFVWHGIMKKPYQYRLFSPSPPGLRA